MLKSCPHGRSVILSISKTVYLKESISSSVGVIRDKFKFWSALEKNRFWQSTFSESENLTVKADMFFDAWMEAFCSKRTNLFWALLWNDNSLSCCRWSRRSFWPTGSIWVKCGSRSQIHRSRRANASLLWALPKLQNGGCEGGEAPIPAGRGMVFLSRLWSIYGCLCVFTQSFGFGCPSEQS